MVFLPALLISVVGFYVVNLMTNSLGIYPDDFWFFILYATICLIFVIEFWMIFYSINQSAKSIRTAAELNVATNIQKSMLPCIFPAFPDRREFDIFATMDPAKEVGGDFYDFFMVDNRHLAIVVADVSGKGVPAALFMVIGKTLIKDHTKPGRDLGEVFTEVNNLLCESNSEGMFITAFEGVLDLVTGEFLFVNAGHEIPFVYRKGKAFEPYKVRAGFVLAGMEGIRYQCGSMQLQAGDRIFQYTDGVTEATNKVNELYYFIRLVTILYWAGKICYTPLKTVLEDADMPRYIVTLTNDEIQELKALIQKGGKGYRIKHAQILLKLDHKPENKTWTYDRIKDAYGASRTTIAGIAQRFVMEGMEAALGRKVQENRRRKVTGDVEARICAIACSQPPQGASRWTMQAIADELIRLEVVDYITDTTVCEVMKKTKSSRGL